MTTKPPHRNLFNRQGMEKWKEVMFKDLEDKDYYMAKKKEAKPQTDKKVCEICEGLMGVDYIAQTGMSEALLYRANLIYLMAAINYWMKFHGYEFGDEKNPDVPIEDGQLIDAHSEITEIRLEEGGDPRFLKSDRSWKSRKMINYWRRTGRKQDGPFRHYDDEE
jgi:hypothetical protein